MFYLRIDDRFIHGQVGCTWIAYTNAKEVLIANDDLTQDVLAMTMQKLSAPTIKVTIKEVDQAVSYIKQHQDKEHLFVIVSCPQDVIRLIKQGVSFDMINIGHSKHREDSKEIVSHVNVGIEELAAFQELQDMGIPMEFRLVPDHRIVTIDFHAYDI